MRKIKSLMDIDIESPDGDLLIRALAQLSGFGKYAKMEPDEIIEWLYDPVPGKPY